MCILWKARALLLSRLCGRAPRALITLLLTGWASLTLPAEAGKSAATRSVPLCAGITLSASYIAAIPPAGEPGFQFRLSNHTAHAIRLAQPIPSSSHWYARAHDRWMWRASSGAGGSLLNAGNEHGRVVVYPAPGLSQGKEYVTLQANASREWTADQQQNPVLAYKPGCPACLYPGEREYQVVFAYAYLAADQAGLLPCGLRSAPVPMPPKF